MISVKQLFKGSAIQKSHIKPKSIFDLLTPAHFVSEVMLAAHLVKNHNWWVDSTPHTCLCDFPTAGFYELGACMLIDSICFDGEFTSVKTAVKLAMIGCNSYIRIAHICFVL